MTYSKAVAQFNDKIFVVHLPVTVFFCQLGIDGIQFARGHAVPSCFAVQPQRERADNVRFLPVFADSGVFIDRDGLKGYL